jgi:protein ImuB
MKRVASLYLPDWSIDRVRRAERRRAPPPEGVIVPDVHDGLLALKRAGDAERGGKHCDAPRNTGWRPGARWARADEPAVADSRADVARRIAALPAHQRPPMRELGRRSEAADNPYKRLPGDDGGKSDGWREPGRGANAVSRRRADSPHPDRDAPMVTVHKIGSRVEVAAACPAARALGALPGMALTQVRAATPDIAVRDADPAGDHADLSALAVALARRWSPVVALSDPDGLFIDLTGVAHLHGGETAMAQRIVRLLARLGFAARIGIADSAGAAWGLARHATGGKVVRLVPGAGIAPLAPLPVAALRIDDATQELLRRLGVETVGALVALPRAPLVRRFGRTVALRIDQASGHAAEPLDPVVPGTPIAVEQRFAEPLLTADPIAHWLTQLIDRLATDLAAQGRGCRVLLLAATRVDAAVQTLRIGFSRPVREPAHMLRLLLRQIERIDPGFGIEALALHVLRHGPLGAEALARDLADGERTDLAPLVDTLVNRIGPRRLWRTRAVESDVPERSVASAAPLDQDAPAAPRLRREDVRLLDTRAVDHPWHVRWPRPVRLLHRPEPIDHVLAEMPDRPPLRFTWRGETHRVVRGDGPERIAGEWWQRSGERDAVRDYFRVEDEAGHRFWLFRRGDGTRPETGDLTWFIHGAFS